MIAITRGGLVPAAIVARELGVRIIDTVCIASYDHTRQGELKVLKGLSADTAKLGGGTERVASLAVALVVKMLDALPDATLIHVGDDLARVDLGGELHLTAAVAAHGVAAGLDETDDGPGRTRAGNRRHRSTLPSHAGCASNEAPRYSPRGRGG